MFLAYFPIYGSAYQPDITVLGMGGPYFSAWMDGLMPLYQSSQKMFYADIQFQESNTDAGVLSAGSGYRTQTQSNGIVGAYLFYDRERSASEAYYNVISPGVEYLTPRWQYRFNYYLPFARKTYQLQEGWADTMGNSQLAQFSGHSEYDQMQYNYESTSYGADFTVGYRFQADDRFQINLSPYAFDQTESNAILGANAQINFYSNDHTTLFVGDGYDNVNHNRIFVGISFTFGGHNNDNSLDNLMQSPVYRNLDTNTTANGLPVDDYTKYGPQELEADNIYFVNNTSSMNGDGTYENPYNNIDSVNDIEDTTAQIRVEETGTTYASNDTITLVGTQTIGGYTDNYTQLASGNNRPIIQSNGFVLEGVNSLSHLQLLGNGDADSVGIEIHNTATLDDIIVGSTDSASYFQTGVKLTYGATGTITNSVITGYVPSGSGSVYGIDSNNATLTVNDSTINGINESTSPASLNFGINQAGGVLSLNNSTVTCSTTNGNAHALYLNNAGDVSVLNSTIDSSSVNGNASGVYMLSESGNVTISDSTISAVSTSNGGHAYGIYNSNNTGDVTINSSDISVQANSSAIGLDIVGGTGTTTLNDSDMIITGTGDSSTATGVYNSSSGLVTVTNNTITLDAITETGIDNVGSGTFVDENNLIN